MLLWFLSVSRVTLHSLENKQRSIEEKSNISLNLVQATSRSADAMKRDARTSLRVHSQGTAGKIRLCSELLGFAFDARIS